MAAVTFQLNAKSAADACANFALKMKFKKECTQFTKYLFNEMPFFPLLDVDITTSLLLRF